MKHVDECDGCPECCDACEAATGGQCREHQQPECVCYEMHSDWLCGWRPKPP